ARAWRRVCPQPGPRASRGGPRTAGDPDRLAVGVRGQRAGGGDAQAQRLKTPVRAAHDGRGMPGFSLILRLARVMSNADRAISRSGEKVTVGVNGPEEGSKRFASLQAIPQGL